tara:strand:+ start:64 stop:795 length:732 start_codon:yes stop_codon:yes gene_type:complete
MKKIITIFLLFASIIKPVSGQNKDNYSDYFLTSSFKLYQSADRELAYHMLPFIRERFIQELKDTLSFTNKYDSLSRYIGIKYSSDSLLKTYCWSERSGGCCHTSATFAQFKTKSGEIKHLDLEKSVVSGNEIFITDLQKVEIKNKPFYLLLGWGTCCGAAHFQTAKIYEIKNDTLVQVDSAFDNNKTLYIGAKRSQKIELKYSPKTKILSYNKYKFDSDSGFYNLEKSIVKWELKDSGFKKIN